MNRRMKRIIPVLVVIALIFACLPVVLASGETTGTFTAVAMNVDGLPQKILGIFTLNGDGPGSDGTKVISQKMATYGWDIIGVSEDFNYHTELMSSLTDYSSGTSRGGISGLNNDTDGLNLLWKNSVSVTGESWTSWEEYYATGIGGNGADDMIDKGYRYYTATVADGVTVDVYVLHMDADSDAGDIAAREAQLTQLATAIKASDNKNPILVIGDTNCRYTRENLQTLFIDTINADSRFTIQDAWIEKVRNGAYPTYGSDALVAVDKGGTYEYPEAEIVDKIFYINNTDSDVTLTANSYTIATDFTDDSGTALADHWPVVVEFAYQVGGACDHSYEVVENAATCTEAGSYVYTCSKCGDSYTETIDATGHSVVTDAAQAPTCTETGLTAGSHCSVCNTVLTAQTVVAATGHSYADGVCGTCGAADPDYEGSACEHAYDVVENAATCTQDGSYVYTCSKCGDSYTETISATGHTAVTDAAKAPTCTETGLTAGSHCSVCNTVLTAQTVVAATGHSYADGVCGACGATDPDYTPDVPADTDTLGAATTAPVSGNRYVLAFSGTTGVFAMTKNDSGAIAAAKMTLSTGDEVAENMIWTIEQVDGGYTISTEIDGQKMYLYRTKTFTGYGYRVALRDTAFVWKMKVDTSNNSVRFYDQASYGSTFYLRYYNARQGWIATTRAAGVKVYAVE